MGEGKELGIIKERYQLIRIIGAGGFGTTYLAVDPKERIQSVEELIYM
ncbi:hypothetical protein [Hespellia stercorisuis]|uniref:Serine/threonine protein kinase n=1 Tax=Hespellia stercorisuis DSM 15480 TaxID=1121950 RepID=A0A1M6WKC9_9FIRM|nr:hypothetical protein [Hespellia stercorisuis]SHK94210.1 hypothetical protein SAMN02745243_04041 [Hespellia stercorisuis DSM 15480]